MNKWRVFWVPKAASAASPRVPTLAGWADLAAREASTAIRPRDPILLAPDYRVDELLSLYTRSSPFRNYTKETKRNYITDDCLFLNFLWLRGKIWTQAVESDMDDFQFWRQASPDNPVRVSGNKWNRELAALMSLYSWATKPGNEFMPRNPVPLHQVVGRHGQIVEVADGKAKDARGSNVHWLTPRTFRLWADVGLRGFGADGLPVPDWVGRLEEEAAPLAGVTVAGRQDGLAQGAAEQDQIVGGDVGAQQAGVHAAGAQLVDEGVAALGARGGGAAPGGVALNDGAVAGLRGEHLLEEPGQRLPGVLGGGGLLVGRGEPGAELLLQDGEEQVVLGREVAVQGAHADATAAGDLADFDGTAVLGEVRSVR